MQGTEVSKMIKSILLLSSSSISGGYKHDWIIFPLPQIPAGSQPCLLPQGKHIIGMEKVGAWEPFRLCRNKRQITYNSSKWKLPNMHQ